MKKNQLIILLIVGFSLIGGILFVASITSESTNDSISSQELSEEEQIRQSSENKDAVEEQQANGNSNITTNANRFITYEDYQINNTDYPVNTMVYFFHADWCPVCVSIEKEINQDPKQIPEGITFIKTDFDSSTDLRKKYGVTTQYTFVQIDNSGNEIKQWSSTNLASAIANIKQ